MTAAVGKSNTKDGLKAVIGSISVELWKDRMWKLLTKHIYLNLLPVNCFFNIVT
jgi:hypothetical protein